ncbi:Flp pilus assembly complex ATPase component TadA [Shewanella sp. SW36]|uniref:ATPase, T2SS/T4P/T4SS family n=1 Tax=Shewanella oncorhynchi TaxID=2726434 RepID=A0AA50Q779_9GAMM|nr:MULTISPECIES: GspE/PulE family protein [Shewanella]MBS0043009.1 Flp pilus assembly complex ATPase component TadA [Shewanella sp. M16]MCU7975087.1 Flp pilus assembly complex ATPase component TadA [Shewanella sp. SW36]MCU7990476.1 Flp pilus assembly complex ATPase component TadA [Shewanella sp. SW1]MCU8016144.1 Flp pilus assembly complex ATPase component TadA [Shewanella sp. SM72]MCU8051681.1 Flp pilus assembly complex ATPase component TadA [Shewanella sp. SM43]
MKPRLKMRLGDLLVQETIITEAQLQQALAEQRNTGKKLGRTLIDLQSITEHQLLQFLSQQLNVPLLDISKMPIPAEVVHLIPEVQARRFRALAVEDRGDSVLVAMSDPADLQALDHLEMLIAPKRLKLAVAPEQQLLQAFDNLYRRTDQIAQIAGKLEEEYAADEMFDLASLTSGDSDNETTVVKLLQSIFEDAVQMRASDIHIEPGDKALRIRQRIDGQLHETILNEVNIAAALVLRLKLMAGLDISEKRLPQDGRFHMEIKGHHIDVRMSTMPIYHGESVVMRLLDQSAGLLTLNETGMPPAILARIRKQIKRPHGMLLVTGPTGSGKTTTLYGILSELNTADRKIITVEDPVEYQLPRINQVQVNHKIGLNFSNVLRTTLRQDPDIIMVGEMRDQETVEIGLRGALTGHFVLSTLHTNDAVTSALRLLDMGAASYLVASALRVIIAQRLVRRVCHNCGVEYQPTPQEKAWLSSVSRKDFTHANFRIGTGCQSCNGSGYRGRIGIFEILELDEKMIDAMRTGNPQDFARAALQSPNFTPLAESALQYLSEGMTTIEEVAKLVEDVSESQIPLSKDIISQQGVEA